MSWCVRVNILILYYYYFSVNLMTCISSLCNIGRQRPLHIATVVQTFEVLQGTQERLLNLYSSLSFVSSPSVPSFPSANLPPSYTSSQITSVTKHLKVVAPVNPAHSIPFIFLLKESVTRSPTPASIM